jgi:excisionase family DNA binding protein
MTTEPLLLTPQQAFNLLQVKRSNGWRMIQDGTIPSVRLSPRVVRVPRQALEEMIAQPRERALRNS